jgi:arylsulfatase A-like enzyme
VAWSWAFDTPFSWTKQIASHFGGVKQGMAIMWPKAIKDKGGVRHQFHHVIDIVPTILEAAQIKQPEIVDGIKQSPIEGVSMTYTFDKANAAAPSARKTQYFEMMGDHAIYHDGWMASTKVMRPPWVTFAPVSQDPASFPWELYDLRSDWTQSDNVADKNPAKLKELQLCSPTRAALITGRNHHSAGFGVISEQSTGFPGYDSIITRDKATIGRILKDNGYARHGSARTTMCRRSKRARTGRSISGRSAWVSSTFPASSAATPINGSRTCFATPRRFIRSSASRAGT